MPERKRATYLEKLQIKRVDVVHRGANPGARILIHKSADYECPGCSDVSKALANAKPAPGKKCPVCGQVVPQPQSKGASDMPDTDLSELKKALDDAVAAAVAPLQAQLDAYATEKADFEQAVAELAEPTDVDKGDLPEAVRKRLEDAEAVAKAAEARIAKMEDDADTAKWQGVAKGLDLVAVAKDINGDGVADLAGLLKAVNKGAGAAAADYLASLLAAGQKKLKDSELLAEAGTGGTSTGDAEGALEKAAAELRKADPSLTVAQSITKAADTHPDLAVAAQQEMLTHA